MRLVASLIALFAASPAFAGGIGPLVMGGFHTERVAYYSSTTDNQASGVTFSDPSQYTQFNQTQIIGNAGAGLELVLGDRDDLVQGVFRGYWMMDTPQSDPAIGDNLVDDEVLVANWRENINHIGVGTVGMSFGVLRAANNNLKLSVAVNVGSGFATTNHTEFFLGQAGLNVDYLINRSLEFYVDVCYGLRIRKTLSHGVYGTAGLRVMFD
ncbi:MAG: hypothetical protein H6733_12280 [Alphaproteobacteria bacterium]|nr:hypothetical protein [Alphaproteobacteria bacterium]